MLAAGVIGALALAFAVLDAGVRLVLDMEAGDGRDF